MERLLTVKRMEAAMKKILRLFGVFFLVAAGFGCTTIYSAAVDERNVKTIADDVGLKTKIVKRFLDDDLVKTFDISTGCYNGHISGRRIREGVPKGTRNSDREKC
jgi:hypothetical protein